MRIGINALYLIPGKVGGSETYIRNLARGLAQAGSGHEFFIFINKESAGVFETEAPGMQVVQCNVAAASRPARIIWEQFVLPLQLRRLKIDVLLSAGMTTPFVSGVPSVVVIYDLQHRALPHNFAWWYLQFLRSIIYLSAKSADSVITISNKSRDEISHLYDIAPERIAVTHLAADERLFYRRSASEVAAARQRYGLPERFILYAASSLPHKNYERLLAAFKRVSVEDRGVTLLLAGARSYGMEAIEEGIRRLGLSDRVVFSGWLPHEDLPAVYSASELLVFPSLYEGFGMPVLEAFACGVPVVCSNIAPLTEVASDAAVYVDPLDEADIAKGILSVLSYAGLRDRLIRDGLRRVAAFSWAKTAAQTLEVLERHAGARL
ncbi:MAG: glycosyltransferase family 4 protein [Deltaproteobacteria bacterium]|nr:glycosyltransferase family 4 protein [Deltaproteobacteria bacterium]